MKIVVTGANGFIGTTLCGELLSRGHEVRAVVRRQGSAPTGTTEHVIGDIGVLTAWDDALAGQDAVVHLAARVHVMTDDALDPLAAFRAVNTDGTLRLAEAASRSGVSSFVFLSSIKANGEGARTPYSVHDEPSPVDPYGISKLEAERGLEILASTTAMHITSIRTPLVYGPGVRGNFERLLRLVSRGAPLPLAGVDNRRTMISVWNLADLIEHQLHRSTKGHEVILAGDADSLSTPDLIRAMGRGIGRSARLIWVPVWLLTFLGRVTRRQDEVQRLVGSLEVFGGSTDPAFSWKPALPAVEEIERAAREWASRAA